MVQNAESTVNQFLRKESLAVLAKMGYAKEEARRGPHKYHGIAARARLSVAGKVSFHPRSLLRPWELWEVVATKDTSIGE